VDEGQTEEKRYKKRRKWGEETCPDLKRRGKR
jgi:hypothetical protein